MEIRPRSLDFNKVSGYTFTVAAVGDIALLPGLRVREPQPARAEQRSPRRAWNHTAVAQPVAMQSSRWRSNSIIWETSMQSEKSSWAPTPALISRRRWTSARGTLLALLVTGLAAAFVPERAGADTASELLRARIEQLEASGRMRIAAVKLTATDLLPRFYARRGFEPAWSDPGRIDALHSLARMAVEEGLAADDYPIVELRRLVASVSAGESTAARVDADILATETLIRIGYHLAFGKVNPKQLDNDWNYERRLRPGIDPVETIQRIIDAPDMRGHVEQLLGRGPFFRAVKAALARYREIERAGGLPSVPEGPTLHPGDEDPRVTALRARLATTGDLETIDATHSDTFDDRLEAAVKRFQARHNLEPDGIVGAKTIAALNVPVSERIDKLRATLERARWVFREVTAEDDFLLVNIAAFRLALVRGGQVDWTTRVVVGTPYHRTPVFKGTVRYLVLNPTWTVPYSIATKELLPKIKRDPGYLAARNFGVLGSDGREVDPSSIDWEGLSRRSFPYTLRQGPGPGNALGRVKFMFPNAHAVYLHDTPARSLFGRAERSFSHGCVRVSDPLVLAERLLSDPTQWSRARIDALIESGETTTVNLAEPLPVYILYITADVGPDGAVRFSRDIYERDAKVLRALDGPVRIELPVMN
jgi:murein L,D-transpeptidase YcbB/YkuD